jgi:hypothetical protein
MKFVLIGLLLGLTSCAPFVAGAAIGGTGGYVIGSEHPHHRCWNEYIGHDVWGEPIYTRNCN